MTHNQEESIKAEFKDFKPPRKFRGGCKRSQHQDGVCVHLTHDGKIGKIQTGCPSIGQCLGENFSFNP